MGNKYKKAQSSLEENSIQNNASFYHHCGAKLSGREKFCPECGQVILENTTASSMEQTALIPSAEKQMSPDDALNKASESSYGLNFNSLAFFK